MALLDGIRTEVGKLREAINALAQRLSDNPTAEEVSAIAGELRGLTATLDSLDPDVPGGVVAPEGEGGDTPAETPTDGSATETPPA